MRFHPRFSIRTLAIFVTLVCAYFGAWEATKRYGIKIRVEPNGWKKTLIGSKELQVLTADSPMPAVLRCRKLNSGEKFQVLRHYYVWLFGPIFELPFETVLSINDISTQGGDDSSNSAWEQFVGIKFSSLGDAERRYFVELFRQVTGDAAALPQDYEFVPHQMVILRGPQTARIFIEIAPGFSHPGFCGLRVHCFDEKWRPVSKDAFATGYRSVVKEVEVVSRPEVAQDLVLVKTAGAPFSNHSPVSRLQYYAVISGKLMLVRLENADGDMQLNSYSNWTVPQIGMNYPQASDDETLDLLRIGTAAERLAILVWLSGEHMPSSEARMDGMSRETMEAAMRFERIKASPRLPAIINELKQSDNAWISQYARKFT